MTPSGPGSMRYRDDVFAEVAKTADIPYGSATRHDGTTQTLLLDLYQPSGDRVAKRPVIIWVHGGSFRSGSKTSPEIVDQANTFARKGYVNVSISYRLRPTGCSTITAECVHAIGDAKNDAQAAVRFLRKHASTYRIDPSRIAIAGTSAGAITALNVAYGPDQVGSSGNPGFASTVRSAVSLSGAAILTAPDPGESSALLLHGTSDGLVPYQWARDTTTNARNAGLHVELTTWQGAGHVPYTSYRTQILTETRNFLYWTLDLKNAAR